MRFLLGGGLAALANWGSRIIYSLWLGYSTAIVLAFCTGLTTGYLLMRFFVFGRGSHSLRRSGFYYVLINGVGLALTWGISVGLGLHAFPALGMDFFPLEIAHAVGLAVPAVTSYLGHKHITFG